ncbi:hypothetical protein HCB45_14710, partial [Listeria sp. FSL L7-0091]|uniref:Ig-like domain-containing protein n=1 Tax=Listeria farberi TaxID=2713500 RepID=UPI00162621E5
SNGGEYEDSSIKWEDLLNEEQEVSYVWQDNGVSQSNIYFSGTHSEMRKLRRRKHVTDKEIFW